MKRHKAKWPRLFWPICKIWGHDWMQWETDSIYCYHCGVIEKLEVDADDE